MADLVVLQRSDNGLICIAASSLDEAPGFAARLSCGQAFTVNHAASLIGLGEQAEAVHSRLLEHHVANGWFATTLPIALRAAMANMDAIDTSSFFAKSKAAQILPGNLLKPCSREEAPVAAVIKKALKHKLGNERAKRALAGYKELALRTGGICKRFLVDENGATMAMS